MTRYAYDAADRVTQQTVEAARAMLHSEIVRWTQVVRSSKIEVPN